MAARKAALTGSPVVVEDATTATSDQVVNPDGSVTQRDYAGPVRVQQAGEWVNVDYTLVKQSDGTYAPKASPAEVAVSGGNTKQATEVTFDDGTTVGVSWPQALPAPSIDGGVATYKISATADLIVAMTGTGVATRIRLNAAPTSADPVWKLGLR